MWWPLLLRRCRLDLSWRSGRVAALPLPGARLRAHGSIVEIGVDELAMDVGEATELMMAAGVEPVDAALCNLVERTEGWPVGLYLAALAKCRGARNPGRCAFPGTTGSSLTT